MTSIPETQDLFHMGLVKKIFQKILEIKTSTANRQFSSSGVIRKEQTKNKITS